MPPDVPGNLSCSCLTLDNTSLFPYHSFQMIRDPSRMDPGVTAVFLGTTLDEASGFVSQMGAGTSLRQQPTRAVHRFYVDAGLKCVDKFGLGLGAFHCVDVNHSIMSDVALGYLNEQEQRFGWTMVGKWIDVALGEDSFVTKDQSDMKGDQVALQITKDFQVTTCPLERMDREKLELMDRNAEWAVRLNQASLKSSA
ncbi:hypothetical protein CPB97_008233 [Podila verticillata]|nr:hypothetical protein CPB97_008233 [Podila verticillata]